AHAGEHRDFALRRQPRVGRHLPAPSSTRPDARHRPPSPELRSTRVTVRNPRPLVLLTAVAAASVLVAAALVRPTDPAAPAPRHPPANGTPAAAGADHRADEAAVRKAVADYVAALNAGDLNAILSFWAPDADYIDESGRLTRGRDAVAALF